MFTSESVPSPSLFGKGSSVVAVLKMAAMERFEHILSIKYFPFLAVRFSRSVSVNFGFFMVVNLCSESSLQWSNYIALVFSFVFKE